MTTTPRVVDHELHAQIQYRLMEALEDRDGRLLEALRHNAGSESTLQDELTGLASRAQLDLRAVSAFARAGRYRWSTAVLVIDIDRFREINEMFGHQGGDEVLVEVGRRLATMFRGHDTVARVGAIVSRFAGDEFVVVCEDVTTADARSIAMRTIRAFDAPVRLAETDLPIAVTASVGVALAPSGAMAFDACLLQAETAARRAKASGGGRVNVFAGGA
ncbi:MAG: hypothetical protein QOC92_691, partial [Acidimicrobiaceae bacterium]